MMSNQHGGAEFISTQSILDNPQAPVPPSQHLPHLGQMGVERLACVLSSLCVQRVQKCKIPKSETQAGARLSQPLLIK